MSLLLNVPYTYRKDGIESLSGCCKVRRILVTPYYVQLLSRLVWRFLKGL